MSDDEFRAFAQSAVSEFGKHPLTDGAVGRLRRQAALRPAERPGRRRWPRRWRRPRSSSATDVRRLHYLSVPPKAALDVVTMLNDAKLVERSRVVMEKPFGTDLESAVVAERPGARGLPRRAQIFRIDHFLGKEAAQNILALRFANGLFEPIWNRNFIDHIQIDIPETLGLDRRAGFYESTGAYKDMVVTHLFQVLAFVAMEPPTALEPRAISEEKNKVFRSLLPIDAHPRGPRAVQRLPRAGGGGPRLGHRDLHRAAMPARQLALGRGAVLPAHRQAAGRGAADHLDRLQGGAAVDVPAGLRGRLGRPGPPDVRPGRRVQGVAVLLRQAARARG